MIIDQQREISSYHEQITYVPKRDSTQLFLSSNEQPTICPLSCGIHGKCIAYINKNSSYFCKCNQGYSGIYCQKEHNCTCSSDSLCITSSICICPINKFGSKCYLKHSFCQSCENNGLFISNDNRFHLTNNFTCLCQEEFYGIRCENTKNQIDIEFNEETIKKYH
ncbi:unnamed protein product [Adineta steineri]|uniref:EGF-like domain-containing protein n=1 Tax=Adineta steineri TaxID=433720 RepID=A0A813SN59_9BILA|nr:unnamed protein product [Adineta steineri]CAF0796854.1 unnamed protein product [Adineta steineri]